MGIEDGEIMAEFIRTEEKVVNVGGPVIFENSDWFETMFKCSECGALIKKEDKFRSFFCYHCGAKGKWIPIIDNNGQHGCRF